MFLNVAFYVYISEVSKEHRIIQLRNSSRCFPQKLYKLF